MKKSASPPEKSPHSGIEPDESGGTKAKPAPSKGQKPNETGVTDMKRFLAAMLALMLCVGAMGCACAEGANSVTTSTTLAGASYAKLNNVNLAASSLNGVTIPCGASFSFNEIVGPRTEAYGYQRAANGRGARVTGGGVAQCATTLYLALRQLGADVEYTSLTTYGSKFSDNYVSDGSDAILVDYSSGTDFAFVNHGEDMFIEMWATDSQLYCSITLDAASDGGVALDWLNAEPVQSARRSIASSRIDLSAASDAVRNNVSLAASSINDTVLASGDLFSFNGVVGPRSERYGYVEAVNGRGAEVVGGGVAQVASALWLAVKNLDCVAMVEKSTYGSRYNQSYVTSSNDAILTDYNAGTDFSFRNIGSEPLTIAVYISGDALHCEIYQD